MGCSASTPEEDSGRFPRLPSPWRGDATKGMLLSGTVDGSTTLRKQQLQLHVEYAALTRASEKDQDRFFALPQGRAGLICGICDGHSVHSMDSGQRHAEAAARHLASDLWRRVHDKLETVLGLSTVPKEGPLAAAATHSFLAHQEKCEAAYQRDVAEKVLAMKRKIEAELGEELPLELPQEGGTTATALLLHPEGLLTCWVGDSRAIVATELTDADEATGRGVISGAASVGEGGNTRLLVSALTQDHNTSDESERERLLKAGGSTGKVRATWNPISRDALQHVAQPEPLAARCRAIKAELRTRSTPITRQDKMHAHVFVKDAEGGLKVTRSLGDSPFHKGDAVSATPGLSHITLTAATRFVIVASDGVWDHLSNEQVATIAMAAISSASPSQIGPEGVSETSEKTPRGGFSEKSEGSGSEKSGSSKKLGSPSGGWRKKGSGPAALAACAAILDHIEAGQASGELDKALVDDRSIAVLVFRPGAGGQLPVSDRPESGRPLSPSGIRDGGGAYV